MRERSLSSAAPVVSNPPEKASIIGALSLLTAVSIRVHEALRSARSIFDISFFWAAAESGRTASRFGPAGRTPRMSSVWLLCVHRAPAQPVEALSRALS